MSNFESSSWVCWVILCSAGRNWDHRRGQRNWSTTDCRRRCDSIGTGLAKNNVSLRGAEIHTCTITHTRWAGSIVMSSMCSCFEVMHKTHCLLLLFVVKRTWQMYLQSSDLCCLQKDCFFKRGHTTSLTLWTQGGFGPASSGNWFYVISVTARHILHM